jgi:multiple sugar transport system substrate-binding protein
MKRILAVLVLSVLVLGIVPASAELAKDTKADLVFQTWTVEITEVMELQLAEFKKLYPNINVELEFLSYNDYWTKLPIAIAGGAGPDIYIMTRANFDAYARAGQCLDFSGELDNYPMLQEDFAGMIANAVSTYQYHGKQMGVPLSVESTGIIFNKDIFEAAGLPLPSEIEDTWTWDDLKDLAQQLTVKEGDETKQYGYYIPANRMPTLEYIWATGTELFNEDGTAAIFANEQGISALNFLNTLMNVDKVSPTIAFTQSQSATDLFFSGKIAMMSINGASINTFREITDFSWDVAEMPKNTETGLRYASSNVLGYIIGPNTKNEEAALTLLSFLASAPMQGLFSEKGIYIPATISEQSAYFEGKTPDNIMAFQRALAYTKPLAFSEYLPYSQFVTIITNALTNAYNGVNTPAE